MKRKKGASLRKAAALVLAVVLALSAASVGCVKKVRAYSYNPEAAMSYAAQHWNDGVGLCAEFVSRCVQAGGIGIGTETTTYDCYLAIQNATGVQGQELKLDSNGYATRALDGNILARGDVVIQWCYTHNVRPHILICSGYDSSGFALFYAHNSAMNNERYRLNLNTAYQHTAACDMRAKVQHLSAAAVDTVKPTISNVKVGNLRSRDYSLTFNVSDNVGVTSVKCRSWTAENGQDDAVETAVPVVNGSCTYIMDYSDHKYQTKGYITHIYAYDKAGNCAEYDAGQRNLLKTDDYGTPDLPDEFRGIISAAGGPASGRNVAAPETGGEITLKDADRKDRYQQWRFRKNEDGSYYITNIGNGQNLDDANAGTADQNLILSNEPNTTAVQQWFIYKDKKGDTVHLTPACSKTSVFDTGKNNGRNASLWTYSRAGENPNQLLKIDQLVDVTGISIDNADESDNNIFIGESEQLDVSCTPENADFDQDDVTYTSSDEDVLTVDKTGRVTAISKGKATVTASYGDDIQAEITYTVKKPVTSIMINTKKRSLVKGDTEKLNVIYRPGDADFDSGRVVYTSSDENILTIDEDGTLTAVGSGDAEVTASYEALKDTIEISVSGRKLESLTIENDDVDEESENVIHPGDTAELKIGCYPEDADFDRSRLTFESSDEDVLTVDEDGVITPVSVGTAVITVKYGDSVEKELTYKVKQPVTRLFVIPEQDSIEVGGTTGLDVRYSPTGADYVSSNTQYSSDDESIATVDSQGTVTGIAPGDVDIIIDYGDIQDKVTITVTGAAQETGAENSGTSGAAVTPACTEGTGTSGVSGTEAGIAVSQNPAANQSGGNGTEEQQNTAGQNNQGQQNTQPPQNTQPALNTEPQQNGTGTEAGKGLSASGLPGLKKSASASISTVIRSIRQTGRKASKTGKIKVRYKKVKSASVYQVQYSLNRKFRKGKKYRTTTVYTSSTSTRLKKLEKVSLKGRRFYVRVRPIMNNGKNGAWSKVKAAAVR